MAAFEPMGDIVICEAVEWQHGSHQWLAREWKGSGYVHFRSVEYLAGRHWGTAHGPGFS